MSQMAAKWKQHVEERQWLVTAIALAVLLAFPLVGGSFYTSVVTRIIILGVFGIAFNLAFGFTNLPSFGHAAFYGLGGYGFALTLQYATPNMLVVPILVAVIAAIVYGFVVAVFASRGKGIYFAVLTFAFAQFLYTVFLRWTEFTGGNEGIFLSMPALFGFPLWETNIIYYLSLATLMATLTVSYRVINSAFGNVMRAVRYNEERAEAIGYPVRRIKIAVFTISAALSSVAGILHVAMNSFVSPSMLFFEMSVEVILVAVIGGTAFLAGPLAGAILLVVVNQLLADYTEIGIMVTGFIFILIIMFFHEGIIGAVREKL